MKLAGSRSKEEGKKIGLSDGIKNLWEIFSTTTSVSATSTSSQDCS